MADKEEAVRPYNGWWYIAGDTPLVIKSPTGSTQSDVWLPLPARDNDRLERALVDPAFREFQDEVVIHDATGERMSKVNFSTMKVTTIYWDSPARPVRRSIWLQMKDDDDVNGGIPAAPEWDLVLEAVYQDNLPWINSGSSEKVVEKLVSLSEPLAAYVLIIRMGVPDWAKITPKAHLENKSVFERDGTIRLYRGYLPYYIAVDSAMQMAEMSGSSKSSKSRVNVRPSVLPSPFESPSLEAPEAPKHLIFAVHGIGQKFAGRRGGSFITDCGNLRAGTTKAIDIRGGNPEDVLILPICWREGLKMGIKSFYGGDTEESFEALVSMITLANIPAIREVASDVGLDILLYMTPAYFKRIIESTLEEIKRVYGIFTKAAGCNAEKTKISFVGHSLGSAIVCDLISFVSSDTSEGAIKAGAQSVVNTLGFPVDRFFAMGSPLAMFFLLKQLKPIGCVTGIHRLSVDDTDGIGERTTPSQPEQESGDREMRPRNMIFACREVYNIFHPYDPRTAMAILLIFSCV
jgi:hypothetical protein